MGGRCALLAAQGKGVLIFPRNAEIGRHVLGGFGHGIDAVLLFQDRVYKTPADGGVKNLRLAAERGLGLAHNKGSPRHGFDAAGNHQLGFASTDGPGGAAHCIHAGTAQAVDGAARHVYRQACQQKGHAGNVAVVFAGLVGTAVENVVNFRPVQVGMTLGQRLDGDGAQVVCTHCGESAAITTDGGANGIDDVSVFQGVVGAHAVSSELRTVPRTS